MNELAPVSMTEPLPAHNAKLPPSIVKIMEGALKAIGGRGTRRLSMSDICNAAEISRGTLYRYFSTKEDVLAAVSEFVSSNFENGVREAAETTTDPMERFRAVMRFFAEYTNDHTPDRIFEIEPSFYIDFFRSHFDRHKIAVCAALNLTFNYLDTLAEAPIDRDGVVEALVRMQLSTLIIPMNSTWLRVWGQVPEKLESWIITLAGRKHAPGEN